MMSLAHKNAEPTLRVVDLITTNEDKRFAPAGRMAEAIIEMTCEQGACSPQDLNECGFTPAEVAQHWHMAQALAGVEMRLMRGAITKQARSRIS